MPLFLTFLNSRLTQLVIRALTIVCAAVFGADAVNSADAGSAISQGANWLLLAVGGILVDLVMHSTQYGKLKAWWAAYTARNPESEIRNSEIRNVLFFVGLGFFGASCLTGCMLPPNPAPSQISVAQDQVTNLELSYTAFTAGIDLVKLNPKERQLVTALENAIWTQLEKAYVAAGQGQNINAHDLALALEDFKRQVIALQNPTPAGPTTRPTP